MSKVEALQNPVWQQAAALAGLGVFVLGLAGVLVGVGSTEFERLFGQLPPLAVVTGAIGFGFIAIFWLLGEAGFAVMSERVGRGMQLAAATAVPFGLLIILLDSWAVLDADLNVPLPEAWLYYPVMGFVAQILFFVLPFGMLIFLGGRYLTSASHSQLVWGSIILVALLEPLFQAGFSIGQESALAVALISLHIFGLSVIQLWLFWRYDFLSMYTFRLVYYLIWHIVWGWLRLMVLF